MYQPDRNSEAFMLLSQNINITGIMNHFIAEYDISTALSQVKADLTSKAKKYDLNLYQQVALVTKSGAPVGYLNPMEILNGNKLNDKKSLEQVVKSIPLMKLYDSTSLVEFADSFGWEDAEPIYFVFKEEEECIGWITYKDIDKSFFHLCLFALILELEENLLKALRIFPRAFDLLNDNRKRRATDICIRNMRENKMVGSPSYQNLVESTTLIDRLNMVRRHPRIKESCNKINSKYCKMIETIRNKIAHAGSSSNLSNSIPQMDLFDLIGWALLLSDQLEKFSEDKSIYQ